MEKWYRQISTVQDLIDFKEHYQRVAPYYGAMENRYYPSKIHVTGIAYYPVKVKALLEKKRQDDAFWGVLKNLAQMVLTGGSSLPMDIARQIGGYASEYYRDRNSPELRAASTITSSYWKIVNDTGSEMDVHFVYYDDPNTSWENPPHTY